jgi:hypothetical protein
MLNKKSGLTYEDVKERYEHFRARCTKSKSYKFIKKLSKESGCTEPIYGIKSKCVINIVPHKKKCKTFNMTNSCKSKRLTKKKMENY